MKKCIYLLSTSIIVIALSGFISNSSADDVLLSIEDDINVTTPLDEQHPDPN